MRLTILRLNLSKALSASLESESRRINTQVDDPWTERNLLIRSLTLPSSLSLPPSMMTGT